MAEPTQSLLQQVQALRALFREAAPSDAKVINDYAWLMVKLLNAQMAELGSNYCRQLLADYLQLPVPRPSLVHSAILASAVRVANAYPDFRFSVFLRMWGIQHFRPEDYESRKTDDGKQFPSLHDSTMRALAHSLLLYPEDRQWEEAQSLLNATGQGGHCILPMMVTRIREALGKDGRKYIFVTLTSPEGIEIESISHKLQPSPLCPQSEVKRHYVNIGQLYDCLLRQKSSTVPSESSLALQNAYLSAQKPTGLFPQEIGYVEAIDEAHGHIHVYDALSRHFVAPKQRFSRENVGDFVRFIPVIPQTSRFKTAIILTTVPSGSSEVKSILRDISITHINTEKRYAAWELVNKEAPITEQLSRLQLSQGEQSPAFTQGYLNLTAVPDGSSSGLTVGQTLRALIYLKRGKDGQKRPHVAVIF